MLVERCSFLNLLQLLTSNMSQFWWHLKCFFLIKKQRSLYGQIDNPPVCIWSCVFLHGYTLILYIFLQLLLSQNGCKHVLSSASRRFSKEVWRINSSSFTKRIFNYLQCATIPSADVCHSSYVTYQEETYSCLGIGRIPTKG